MKKLTNILLYTWTTILLATALVAIIGGAYLLVETILTNI